MPATREFSLIFSPRKKMTRTFRNHSPSVMVHNSVHRLRISQVYKLEFIFAAYTFLAEMLRAMEMNIKEWVRLREMKCLFSRSLQHAKKKIERVFLYSYGLWQCSIHANFIIDLLNSILSPFIRVMRQQKSWEVRK